MLIDIVVRALLAVVEGVLGLFPAWSFGLDLTGLGQAMGNALQVANNYFPVGVVGACLAVVVGLKLALLGFEAAVFVYKLIPGKFT